MNKQEAIETIKNIDTLNINDNIAGQKVDMVIKNQVLDIISQIDEPQKPVIPQFVAEWIKSQKESFSDASAIDMYDNLTLDNNGGHYHEVWLWVIDHHYDFIKAWIDGYEIEQEKLYTAMLKISGEYLRIDCDGRFDHFRVDRKYILAGVRAYQFTEDDLVKYHILGSDNYEVKEVE